MTQTKIIPVGEFRRVRTSIDDKYQRVKLLADMNRLNTLTIVKRAGSGHLGSSFSAMDIVAWLYYEEMDQSKLGGDNPHRDIYFSSKGHDVPGLYSILYSIGVIQEGKFLKLRRLGGLDGHPDVGVQGIEANSGSLGMGISKGRGMAWAKKYLGYKGRVYVLTGDGEWQEGQNFEALQSMVQQKIDNLTVIIDHNKVQSDKLVKDIIDLGDLETKFRSFGWFVLRIDGHEFKQIQKALEAVKRIRGTPQIVIADTIKGRGVSFMEHTNAFHDGNSLYPWHSGAPDDNSYNKAYEELRNKIDSNLLRNGLEPIILIPISPESKLIPPAFLAGEPLSQAAQEKMDSKVTNEYVSQSFGQALLELGAKRQDLVVLDADLSSDCRLRDFENTFPERFIENGIAEQDMVSMAGGLARMGLLPVVNSFASFLASRANEQIYNNASEKTKIIYGLHYAGIIPAGPGKSHQSVRDISLLSAIPNIEILEPCNSDEAGKIVKYCVQEASSSCAVRLIIGPSPRKIELPEDYVLKKGRGIALNVGADALLFAYGPVMLHEALVASELLLERGMGLQVVNMPWLNRIDPQWLLDISISFHLIFVLEDHSTSGGLTQLLRDTLANLRMNEKNKLQIIQFAIEGWPACGTPQEVLRFHKLDGASLAERILEASD